MATEFILENNGHLSKCQNCSRHNVLTKWQTHLVLAMLQKTSHSQPTRNYSCLKFLALSLNAYLLAYPSGTKVGQVLVMHKHIEICFFTTRLLPVVYSTLNATSVFYIQKISGGRTSLLNANSYVRSVWRLPLWVKNYLPRIMTSI